MSQAKSGILVLTDPQYENYLHLKEEANRLQKGLLSGDCSPANQPAALENNTIERADDLLEKETAHQVGSILRHLGLQEVQKPAERTSLVPAHVSKPRFSSQKELTKSITRLTEKRRDVKPLLFAQITSEPKTKHRRAATEKEVHPHLVRQISILDQRMSQLSQYKVPENTLSPASLHSDKALPVFSDSDSDAPVSQERFDPNAQHEAKKLESALRSPVLMPSKRTLSKYLSEVKSVETAIWEKSTARTDEIGSLRSSVRLSSPAADLAPTNSAKPPHSKPRKAKKRPSKPLTSSPPASRPVSDKPHDLPRVLSEEQKRSKVMTEIRVMGLRKSEEDPTGQGLGDLMRISFRCEPEKALKQLSSSELVRMKNLNARVYSMLSHDPSELYRIIHNPKHSDEALRTKFLLKQEEWTLEHEAAFKTMMRKSHSVNSMAKTRRFRELERNLPPTRTTLGKEWRYDIHSPWVNDLDFHGNQYFSFDLDAQPHSVRKNGPISNIRLSEGVDESIEIDQDELIQKEMRALTGITRPKNEFTLKARAEKIQSLRRFEDAKKGYELIYKWEKSKKALERDEAELACHVIKDLHGDMKQMTKARYSYLSAKIAKQRAKSELSSKLMLEAESKRVRLRKRQEEFQREVAKARILLRKIYGSDYLRHRRRVLENTSHAIGSPMFIQSMVALGFLPRTWEPQPKRLVPGAIKVLKPVPQLYPSQSAKHLSRINFTENPREQRINEKAAKTEKRHNSAVLIQAWYRGVVVRRYTGNLLKGVKIVQRWYRRRVKLTAILTYMLKEYVKKPSKGVAKVLAEYRDTFIFKRILRKFPVLACAFLKKTGELPHSKVASARRVTLRTLNFSPSYDDVKEFQASQAPLLHTRHSIAVTQTQELKKKKLEITMLPTHPIEYSTSPKTPKYRQAKNMSTMSAEEAVSFLQRINSTRAQILQTRTEMWRYFLSSVAARPIPNDTLCALLAKDSVYARKAAGEEKLTWEGSEIKLNVNQPVTQEEFRTVSPQTVSGM